MNEQGGIGTQVESLPQETQEDLTSPHCGEVDEQTKEALLREVREVCPLNPTLLQMVLQTIEKYGSKAVRIVQGTVQAVQEQIDRGNCENSVKMLSGALKSALNGRAWTPNSWKKKERTASVPKESADQSQVSETVSTTVSATATQEQEQLPGSNGSLRQACTQQAITGYPDGTLCYKERDRWYPAAPEPSKEDREWLAIATRLNQTTGRCLWAESLKEFEVEEPDGSWKPLAWLRRTFPLTELRESLRLQGA